MKIDKKTRVILTTLSILVLLSPFLAKAVSVSELEAQMQAKQAEIAQLEKQMAAYQQKLKETKGESQTLSSQIGLMENQISRLMLQVKITQERIVSTVLSIQDLQIKIQQRETDIQRNKDNLVQIIRALDEDSNKSALEIMLANDNFSDFLNQIQYTENLQTGVQQKVTELKALKETMQAQKTEQENQHLALEQLKEALQENQSSLDGQVDEKAVLLKQTKGKEAQYQNNLNELIKKKAVFSKEIQALEQQVIAAKNYLLHTSGEIPSPGTKIFTWPEDNAVITQGYGMTAFAKQGAYGGSPHNGVDFSAGYGSQIKSIGPGKILVKGYNEGWGNWVTVQHTNGLVSLYAHMKSQSPLVIGTQVDAGTVIGYQGNTGFSTGSHLHLSVYYNFFTYTRNGQLYFNYFEGTLNPLSYL